jgi:hypothetical protein
MLSLVQTMNTILNCTSIFIIIFGSIGNFLVYKIYSSAALEKYSISTYFRALAIFDNLTLVSLFSVYLTNQFGIDFSQSIEFFCKFQTYFAYTNGPISAWLMAVISLDRYINIVFSKRFPIIFNKYFQLGVICSIVAFNYVYYSFLTWNSYLVSSDNGTNVTICNISYNYVVIAWMDFFNSTVFPFLLMIVFSLALILSIQKARARIHANNDHRMSNVILNLRDRKFALTIILLNFLFLTFIGPVELFNIFDNFGFSVDNMVLYNLVAYATLQPYYLNYAIGFYAQMIVNKTFRKEFLRLIGRKKNL